MEDGDGGNVQILDEEVDEAYEPTDQEIRDYADWLGINADEDADLLWIARRGLTTPLPRPWRPCQSGQGEIFYFNPETGENTWDHPCDEQLRALYAQEKAKKSKGNDDAPEQSEAPCDGQLRKLHSQDKAEQDQREEDVRQRSDAPFDEQLREPLTQDKAEEKQSKEDAQQQSDAAPGGLSAVDDSISSDVVGNNSSIIGPIGLASDEGDVHESIDVLSLGALSPQAHAMSSPEISPVLSIPSPAEEQAPEQQVTESPEISPVLAIPSPAEEPALEQQVTESQAAPQLATAARSCAKDPPPPPQPPPAGDKTCARNLPQNQCETSQPPPPPLAPSTSAAPKSHTPPPPPAPSASGAPRAGGVLGSLGALPPLSTNSSAADLMGKLEPSMLQPLLAPSPTLLECKSTESESSSAPAPPKPGRQSLEAAGVEDLFKMPLDLDLTAAKPTAAEATGDTPRGSNGSAGRVREAVAAAEEVASLRRRLSDSEAECSKLRASAGEAMRLRRQLETRVEQATAAPAAAAPALSALSDELASEAAECRRWREEGSSRGRDLERLRADSAAEVAGHRQVAADLRAELAAVRVAAARAEACRAQAEASADAAHAEAEAAREQVSDGQVAGQQAHQSATDCSREARSNTDFFAADAPSPPTPELVSILEAELRLEHGGHAEVPAMLRGSASVGPAGSSLASPNADVVTPITREAEQSSLWSHLLEDDAQFGTPARDKTSPPTAQAVTAVASSSLDISSLSAILQRSPLGDDNWGDASEACSTNGGVDDRKRKRGLRPPGLGAAVTDEVSSPVIMAAASSEREESAALRVELKKQAEHHDEKAASYVQEIQQLRVELEQERAERAAAAQTSSATGQQGTGPSLANTLGHARNATEGSSQTEAMTSHSLPGGSLLDPASSRAPTLKLDACWDNLERAGLNATAPRGGLPAHAQRSGGVEDPISHGDKCRSALAALPGQKTTTTVTTPSDAEVEIARLALELRNWREDAGSSERLLHDARLALHKEQASHVATKASMRESQREAHGLRNLLHSHEAKEELAVTEVEQCRSELADMEAERQRMQLQIQTRETELARLRAQQTVQSQQGDAALRLKRNQLAEREEIIGGRERYLDEREQLATEAEAMLRKQRSDLRGELQRAELAGLRATVSELCTPVLATTSPGAGARGRCAGVMERSEATGGRDSPRSSSVPVLSMAPKGALAVGNASGSRAGGRRTPHAPSGDMPAASACPSSDDSIVPLHITRRLDGGRLDDVDGAGASSSSTSPSGPMPAQEVPSAEQATLGGAFTFSQPLASSGGGAHANAFAAEVSAASLTAAATATKVCSADELPVRLRTWRHELRREHAALEEDRRLWRCEARQLRKAGPLASNPELGSGAGSSGGVLGDLGVLGDVRTALDARAAALNASINEYRAIERTQSQSSHSGRRRSSGNAGLIGSSLSTGSRPPSASSSRSGARRRSHSTSSMPTPTTSTVAQRAGSWLDAGTSTVVPGRTGPHEEDLLRRWRHVLQPHPGGSIAEPVASTPRNALLSARSSVPLCAQLAGVGGA